MADNWGMSDLVQRRPGRDVPIGPCRRSCSSKQLTGRNYFFLSGLEVSMLGMLAFYPAGVLAGRAEPVIVSRFERNHKPVTAAVLLRRKVSMQPQRTRQRARQDNFCGRSGWPDAEGRQSPCAFLRARLFNRYSRPMWPGKAPRTRRSCHGDDVIGVMARKVVAVIGSCHVACPSAFPRLRLVEKAPMLAGGARGTNFQPLPRDGPVNTPRPFAITGKASLDTPNAIG